MLAALEVEGCRVAKEQWLGETDDGGRDVGHEPVLMFLSGGLPASSVKQSKQRLELLQRPEELQQSTGGLCINLMKSTKRFGGFLFRIATALVLKMCLRMNNNR